MVEARVGQEGSGVGSGEDDEEWPTGGDIEEASSGGSRSNGSDGGEEAEDDDVSETTVEESSVGADDSEKWAQVVGEEDRQETAGGRRQWWLFDSVNPNAWGAGELGGGGLHFLRRTNADFVGIQEMRVVGQDRCHGGMEAARKAKWKIKITPACVTEKGYASAGVAVACRAQFGMVHPQAQGWEYDTTRMQHAHVGAVCRGGIHCVAVYLYNSEGLSERNRGVLLDLARLIRGLRGPWVVMGDWNLSPEVLQASGWVEEVCGKVLCPSMPTCKNSTIDYFVVDRRLVHAVVYVKRLEGFGITPHYPVRLAIRALMVRRMVAPRKIPAVLPSGCLSAGDYEAAERLQREGGSLGLGREEWRGRMGGGLDAVEGIMCGILGQEGKAAERICGRRHGPRMVWKCALGKPGDDQSFSTKISRSWAKLRGWCHTIRQARNVLGGGLRGGRP